MSSAREHSLKPETSGAADGTGSPSAPGSAGGKPGQQVCTEATERLLERIRHWKFQAGTLLHASIPMEGIDPCTWLHRHPIGRRFFWQNRDASLSLSGIGVSIELRADTPAEVAGLFTQMHHIVGDSEQSFIGGMAFDGRQGRDEWAEFPAASFVLPALVLRGTRQSQGLHVNLLASSHEDFLRQKAWLVGALRQLQTQPPETGPIQGTRILRRQDGMSQDEFRRHIASILDSIHSGGVQKMVLARRVDLLLDQAPALFPTLRRWRASNPGSFSFALETGHGFFVGCSPEQLFSRHGHQLHTESLAGTVRRGDSREEDAQLERLLLSDPKLEREHALVSRFIQDRVAPLANQTFTPSLPGVIKMDRIQHRYLPLQATIKAGVSDDQLLNALHPTPAVCGFPQARARELIQKMEAASRGWYSGVVGVVSPRHAEFAVAIRSALIRDRRVICYSGVGVVDGSQADAEWQELEAKIESLLTVLGDRGSPA